MAYQPTVIIQALAPGVALTSMIFYYGNLQQRMIFTVDTIRRLNEEARELRAHGDARHCSRLDNLDWQVKYLKRRFVSIHFAILLVYAGVFCSILTIMALLFLGFSESSRLIAVPHTTFAIGFLCMASATLVSSRELTLSKKTILADIADAFPEIDLPSSRRRAPRVLVSNPSGKMT
jgi:hypothetical protein